MFLLSVSIQENKLCSEIGDNLMMINLLQTTGDKYLCNHICLHHL